MEDKNKWIYPKQRGFQIGCCGCGLTHSFNFRVKEHNGKYEVEFQMRRNEIVTKMVKEKNINIHS